MRTTSGDPFLYRRSRKKRGPYIGVTLLLLAFAAATIWHNTITGYLWMISSNVLNGKNSGEVAQLQGELQKAKADALDRNALYEENLTLKQQLGRSDAARQLILAGVLLAPPGTPYDSLIIDAGENQGIVAGELVSAGGNALIGTISDVYPTTARVELFSSSGKKYNAFLHHTDTDLAINVEGQGGETLTAQVPSGTAAEVGDVILMPGIASGISATISGIDAPQGDSFKTLFMHLPVPISSVRFVEVWQSPPSLQ